MPSATVFATALCIRLDQGPTIRPVRSSAPRSAISGGFPNGGNSGTATTGGSADAFTDYTIPFDPGNGSIFSVPITIIQDRLRQRHVDDSNTTNYPINVIGGELVAANNNAFGNPNNTPLKGTFANTVSRTRHDRSFGC